MKYSKRSAFMVIDAQNEWARVNPTTAFRLNAAISDMRKRLPILWVYYLEGSNRPRQWPKPRWDNPVIVKPKHPRAPMFSPKRDEWVFLKDDRDAFTNPELVPFLDKHSINHLIIGGFLASQCVWETMLGARDAGLRVTFAADLSADFKDKCNLKHHSCAEHSIRWHQHRVAPP